MRRYAYGPRFTPKQKAELWERDFVAARRARCAYPSLRSQFTQFWRRAPTEPEGGAMNKSITVVLVLVLAAPCSSRSQDKANVPPPMDPARKVSRQVCTRIIQMDGGNLMCIELTAAQRHAELEEEKQQARARREAEERAARERLERERAEQLAREEAARKQRAAEEERLAAARAAEEERLAAERRRLEAEAARKAQEERERQERAEAEARARQRAEQEAREAAERECRRSEEHTSELQSHSDLVCRLLLEKKKKKQDRN